MKKMFVASTFLLAIAGAFAFKSLPKPVSSYASYKIGTTCTNSTGTVACDGGAADCVINDQTFFSDQNCGTVLKKN